MNHPDSSSCLGFTDAGSPSPSATQELAPARRWVLAAPTHPQPTGGSELASARQNTDHTQSRQQGSVVAWTACPPLLARERLRSRPQPETARPAAEDRITKIAQSGGSTGLLGWRHPANRRTALADEQQRADRSSSQRMAERTSVDHPGRRPAQSSPASKPGHSY